MQSDNLITLVTNDGHEITYLDYVLCARFQVIDELIHYMGNPKEIPVDLTFDVLKAVLLFTDTLETPKEDDEWKKLIKGADYLMIQPVYLSFLMIAIKCYMIEKWPTFQNRVPMTLEDFLKLFEKNDTLPFH